MKLNTHLFIEQKVKSVIDELYSTDINLYSLSIGNVFADMSLLSVTHPHYQSKSMNYVDNKLSELCEYLPGIADEFGLSYTLKLGIVTHYICDFFCKAHASNNVGNPKEHVLYEIGLKNYIEDNYWELIDMDFTSDFKTAKSKDEILSRLNNWLLEYHSTEHSFEKDVTMAIRASCYVTASVLEICYERKRRIFEMFVTAYSMPQASMVRI